MNAKIIVGLIVVLAAAGYVYVNYSPGESGQPVEDTPRTVKASTTTLSEPAGVIQEPGPENPATVEPEPLKPPEPEPETPMPPEPEPENDVSTTLPVANDLNGNGIPDEME